MGGQAIKLGSEINLSSLLERDEEGLLKLFDLDIEVEAVTIPVPAQTQQVINVVKILGVKERKFQEVQKNP